MSNQRVVTRCGTMADGTDEEIIADAKSQHPECGFGLVRPGLNCFFQRTRCVSLWRNEECYLAGDPSRAEVEGYPA